MANRDLSLPSARFTTLEVAERRGSGEGYLRSTLHRLISTRTALVGLVYLAILIIAALSAGMLSPYNPYQTRTSVALRPPSTNHLLGTDELGRDILTRILYGARLSLRVGLIAVGIAAAVGTILGLCAGYWGGWAETVIMRCIDVMLAFPGILLAIAITTVLGPSLTNVMIAVGIAYIPAYVRLVRGATLSVRAREYVEGARAIGCADSRIVFRYILPNILAPVIVLSTLGVAGAILTAAGLSFLGLGAQSPTAEWGAMLTTGRTYLRQAWWVATFPGVAIMLTVLAINMIGDALRDALDPRLTPY
ncbi:MAG: ABC transporter permease [Thermomicrobiales bacterium]